MSFSKIMSAALIGMNVLPVEVEADLSNGLPVFHMVGYLSSEVKEASERVRTAIHNSGYTMQPKRIVVNLSPGNIRKHGTIYDLPIALTMLAAMGEISPERISDVMAVGELGLSGRIQGIQGIFPIALEAKKMGVKCLIVPKENEDEAMLVNGLRVFAGERLVDIVDCLKAGGEIGMVSERKTKTGIAVEYQDDFANIRGQEAVKRAVEVAVAGRHNLLMIGPPGGGKTLIAKAIPSILPDLTEEEQIEITKTHSIAGLLDQESPLVRKRPFREVHQTATRAALIGGGVWPKPGEISLASGGVLFLDELAEFPKSVLEVLRQPLEERVVRLIRTHRNFEFPADVMLVGAMNPCPCGCYPDLNKCNCTFSQIQNYLSKISQPFLERIDICIEVPAVAYDDLRMSEKRMETSREIRKRVEDVRQIQVERYQGEDFLFNAELPSGEIAKYCSLGNEEELLMKRAYESLGLTARTYHKILKVARTIADLEGAEQIKVHHLQEALIYRSVDKKYWGNGR